MAPQARAAPEYGCGNERLGSTRCPAAAGVNERAGCREAWRRGHARCAGDTTLSRPCVKRANLARAPPARLASGVENDSQAATRLVRIKRTERGGERNRHSVLIIATAHARSGRGTIELKVEFPAVCPEHARRRGPRERHLGAPGRIGELPDRFRPKWLAAPGWVESGRTWKR